jgi:hypothetical protein
MPWPEPVCGQSRCASDREGERRNDDGDGRQRSDRGFASREHRQPEGGEHHEGDQCDTVAARCASERAQRRRAHGGAAIQGLVGFGRVAV